MLVYKAAQITHSFTPWGSLKLPFNLLKFYGGGGRNLKNPAETKMDIWRTCRTPYRQLLKLNIENPGSVRLLYDLFLC